MTENMSKAVKLMRDMGFDNPVIKEVGHRYSSNFIIKTKERDFFVKFNKKIKNKNFLIKKLKKIINRGYLNNEINIYKILSNKNHNYFSIPEIVSYKKNEYILLEYLESFNKVDIENSKSHVLEALFEFNKSFFSVKKSDMNIVFYNLFKRPVFKLFYLSIFKFLRKIGIKSFIDLSKILLKASIKQKKLNKYFLLHMDIGIFNNNINKYLDKLYLIDFESSTLEKKWILQDIVDLAFNENFRLDLELLNNYVKKLEMNTIGSEINLEYQIRIALIYRVSVFLSYEEKNRENTYNVYLDFLKEILLIDDNFQEWMKNQRRCKEVL